MRIPIIHLVLCCLVLSACGDTASNSGSPAALDVVLSGGTVYSGEDSQPLVQDVGIAGDRIVAIGDLSDRVAESRLDVSGLIVVPGFIDIHSHAVRSNASDGIFRWPDAENLIRQGVTTVIGGPDGGSPLPISATLDAIEKSPSTVNFGTFVGHGSIRGLVVGEDDRPPSAGELEQMRAEVLQAMDAGAFGLSSGLIYTPGRFAKIDEVIEMAKVAGSRGGIYISHMREEGLDVLKSVAETIEIGEKGGLPTQITHHKIVGAPMWGSSTETLRLVDEARARGVDVTIDQYPYTASSTSLTILFPGWSLAGGREALLARFADEDERNRIRDDVAYRIEVDRGGNDPANVVLSSCPHDGTLNGLNLAEILQLREIEVSNSTAAELLIELVDAGNCSAVFHAINAEDVVRIMQHPATMIASDGGIEGPSDKVPHPRNYGTFARFLGHFVREQQVMPMHTAIHKITTLPADRIALHERGRIAIGAIADIAVIDARTVIDTATFADPHQYAIGAHHVFVSGEAALLDGEMTGRLPGKVLRSTD